MAYTEDLSFLFFSPTRVVYGVDSSNDVAVELRNLGCTKAVIVTDRFLSEETGLVKKIEKSLGTLCVGVFADVPSDSGLHVVNQGYQFAESRGAEGVVSVGGGSVIDTAKAVRILSANPGPIQQYEGVHHALKQGTYLAAIATTSGTAAEVTSNAVITDTVRHVKMVLISHATIPDIAVNDPIALASMPAGTTAATGMDALTHAVEAYVSKFAHPLTDHSALEAIRIIAQWLPRAFDNGQDLEAREWMSHGQYLAGMAFNSAGLGSVHSLAHQPGATHNLPHGVCNAILLPVVEEFNRSSSPARFARVAEAMGVNIEGLSEEKASFAALDAIRSLSARVHIPAGFSAFGIKESDIEQWIKPALADPCAPANPRELTADDVRALYKKAL